MHCWEETTGRVVANESDSRKGCFLTDRPWSENENEASSDSARFFQRQTALLDRGDSTAGPQPDRLCLHSGTGRAGNMASRFGSRSVWCCCLVASLGALALGACRATNDGTGPDEPAPPDALAPEPDPCKLAFGEACGRACADDAACEAGLHCKEGACWAACTDSTECGAGECSPQGRCVADDDNIMLNPFTTDPTPPKEGDAPVCIEGQVEFKPVVPQVWLLLDRSGSMSEYLGTTSRWDALGAVLLGEPTDVTDRGVVGSFEDRVAFGAVFYTTGSATTGCVLDLESVALAANNYVDIRQRYRKLSPTGGTPTADSVAATVAVAASSDLTGGPKLLVLATDGAPGSCAARTEAATTEVEKEVALAFSKGIRTFAISIASSTDIPHMQRVANIGVGLPVTGSIVAPLYTAASQTELSSAFTTILSEVPRSCVFSLNGRVQAENADRGSVKLAGQPVTYGDPDGWVLRQPDQVELVGAACDRVQAGEDALDITFPCAVFTPVVVE